MFTNGWEPWKVNIDKMFKCYQGSIYLLVFCECVLLVLCMMKSLFYNDCMSAGNTFCKIFSHIWYAFDLKNWLTNNIFTGFCLIRITSNCLGFSLKAEHSSYYFSKTPVVLSVWICIWLILGADLTKHWK